MIGNVECRVDTNGNVKPVKGKNKNHNKIDGVIAAIMALARADTFQESSLDSAYTERGIMWL